MNSKVIVESGSNYVKFGNGLLIQWGSLVGTNITTYPKPFSSTNYSIGWFQTRGDSAHVGRYAFQAPRTTTNFKHGRETAAEPNGAVWLAIGY